MGFLTYGGVTIGNDNIPGHQLLWKRQAVVDASSNYLYTTGILRYRGHLNRSCVSYILNAQNPGRPDPLQGQDGVSTDLAIRHWMMQPRRVLSYKINSKEGVLCPLPLVFGDPDPADSTQFFACDCANGPVPIDCDVVAVPGSKTFWIDWSVRVAINECRTGRYSSMNNQPTVLLSHTWEMISSTDQDHFSTRRIEGAATFRRDILEKFQSAPGANPITVVPDDFRQYFVHPVPSNMQRVGINVNVLPDGCTVRYTVTDRETVVNIIASQWPNITRIEAVRKIGATKVGLEETIISGLNQIPKLVVGGEAIAGNEGILGTQVVSGALSGIFTAVARAIPLVRDGLVIRIWGNRLATRSDLRNCAVFILRAVFNNREQLQANALLGGVDIQFSEDLMGEFCELQAGIVLGPIQSTIRLGIGNAFGLMDVTQLRMPSDSIPGVTTGDPNVAAPALPNDGGTRGTFLGRLVAQLLLTSCARPPRATSPGYYAPLGSVNPQLVPAPN